MASPFDLIALSDLKSWLDIASTDDDDLLESLITQISRAILTYLDRPMILPCAYTEVRSGGGEQSLVLRNWPALSVSSCTINGITIPPAPALVAGAPAEPGFVLEAADPQPPGRMQILSLRGHRFFRGVQNVTISYRAGYEIAGEAATVPSVAPYTIAAAAPYGPWASDGGLTYGNGNPLQAVVGTPALGQYMVAAGLYTFAAADAGASVVLTYGYSPADIAICCMDWVADRYAYRARIGQSSKSLGGQETTSFIVRDIPAFVMTALQPYRRVVAL